ncbi:MAG: hypothetical protein AAFY46_15705 [Planctomycetota bacterium]
MTAFVDQAGRACREYELRLDPTHAVVGAACRDTEARWVIEMQLAVAGPAAQDGYTPVASSLELLDMMIHDRLGGTTLSPEDEMELMRSTWRLGSDDR